jgi:spore germination protein KA/spore germination protein
MQRQVKRYDNILSQIKSKNLNLGERLLTIATSSVSIFYIKQMTDKAALAERVIKPLMQQQEGQSLKAADMVNSVITADDCLVDNDENKIEQYILDGMTVILFSGDNEYAVVNLKKVAHRSVTEPEFMFTIRGPRDAFNESLETNLSLIRYRLKSQSLRVDMLTVGTRTNTAVAVVYFEDIASNTCVSEVKNRISRINVDGLVSSGELQSFMQNNKASLFPQMGLIERSDMACGALLEGKVVILMDGDSWALTAPKVFSEFLWACDDFYLNKYVGTFMRILRVISLNLSFIISSLYVAMVSFHPDVLPSGFLIAIAQARAKVPFTALLEVLIIEMIADLIRESLIRVPTKIGTAIGVVGAIIIGQAAVDAGIFSSLLLIVVSLSLMGSFVPADYTLMDSFRVLKFLLIVVTGIAGFYGFTLVIIFVLAQLVSINTYGTPYMAPLAPFHFKDFAKSVVYAKAMAPKRAAFLRTKDNTRGPTNKPPKKTDRGQK